MERLEVLIPPLRNLQINAFDSVKGVEVAKSISAMHELDSPFRFFVLLCIYQGQRYSSGQLNFIAAQYLNWFLRLLVMFQESAHALSLIAYREAGVRVVYLFVADLLKVLYLILFIWSVILGVVQISPSSLGGSM